MASERWTSRLSSSLSRDRYSTEPSPYLTLTQIRSYAWLNEEVGDGTVTRVDVRGPGGPSWRKGSLTVPGRGPRDTYG